MTSTRGRPRSPPAPVYHDAVAFPETRLRRLRQTAVLRDLVRETRLDASQFVLPLFVEQTLSGRSPIAAMPGGDPLGLEAAVAEGGRAQAPGLPPGLPFGLPGPQEGQGPRGRGDQ